MSTLTANRCGTKVSYRCLYLAVLDAECLALDASAVAALGAELRGAATADTRPDKRQQNLAEWRRQAGQWAKQEAEQYRSVLGNAGDDAGRLAVARRALLGCAPLGLRSGAWLQWLISPATAEDPAALATLARYASDVGVGHPGQSRGDAYLAAMRGLDLADYATPLERLASEECVAHEAFRLPAVLIAMGRRPDLFTPELLGADECLRVVGLLPALRMVRDVLPRLADWQALDPSRGCLCAPELNGRTLSALPDGVPQKDRLLAGFRWVFGALHSWSGQLLGELAAACDPAFEMAELVRLRSREASVYHQRFRLGNRSLAELLAEARTDPRSLLEALAASRLVRPGRPADSRLLGQLIAENGPMFRVFSPRDRAVISRWIASLRVERTAAKVQVFTVTPGEAPAVTLSDAPTEALSKAPGHATERRQPLGLRDAYQALQSRVQEPRLRAFARDYARDWLVCAARELAQADVLPPEQWSPAGLRGWLAAQHERQAREPDSGAAQEPPDRAELIDSTVQLAPLILLDGAWLRGFTDYSHASTDVGYSLFATFFDELGNGVPDLNHPLIYRQLLAEMGISLPPTGSAEFAQWPGFRDSSFELPVFWLSLGSLPRTLLPETLGLNLAMELSGVGGGYRKAAAGLRAHGFSTRFVDIHNTIDNVVTGHSAWAVDAICAYLAEVGRLHGAAAQQRAWSRVRIGFRSLTPPRRRPRGRPRRSWLPIRHHMARVPDLEAI